MQIKPQFKGNVGMFLVCAELSKQNLIAMPTSRNTKGCDVVVLNPDNNKSIGIQVKCTDKRDFPIMNSHWRDYEKKIEWGVLYDFVFVDISAPEVPRFFIVPTEDMKNVLRQIVKDYWGKYQQKNQLTWEQALTNEKEQKKKPHLWAVKLYKIDVFEDNWNAIVDELK